MDDLSSGMCTTAVDDQPSFGEAGQDGMEFSAAMKRIFNNYNGSDADHLMLYDMMEDKPTLLNQKIEDRPDTSSFSNAASNGGASAMQLPMVAESGEQFSAFPHPLDMEQPAKSWWRYFAKLPENNRALCRTCGQTFNRGPKQSTTSLSHHLRMYHREMFISVQQARDAEGHYRRRSIDSVVAAQSQQQLPTQQSTANTSVNGCVVGEDGASSTSAAQTTTQQEAEESSRRKAIHLNVKIIDAVKPVPELYDNSAETPENEEHRMALWDQIAVQISGEGESYSGDFVKKRWLKIRDQYRKELNFAIRDNFAYTPKWPYFKRLEWLSDFVKDGSPTSTAIPKKRRKMELHDGDLSAVSSPKPSPLSADNEVYNHSEYANRISTTVTAFQAPNAAGVGETSSYNNGDVSFDAKLWEKYQVLGKLLAKQSSGSSQQQLPVEFVSQLFMSDVGQDSLGKKKSNNSSWGTPELYHSLLNQPSTSGGAEGGVSRKFDYLDDEDLLFGRTVGLRLKTMNSTQRQAMKMAIEGLFEYGTSQCSFPK